MKSRLSAFVLAFLLSFYLCSISQNEACASSKTDLAKSAKAYSSNVEKTIVSVISAENDYENTEVGFALTLGLIPVELQGDYGLPITRLQFARLAVQLLSVASGVAKNDVQSIASSVSTFPDTADIDVRTCNALFIVGGFPDGTFRPDEAITREQAAKMLAKLASILGFSQYAEGLAFTDTAGSWGEKYILFVSSMENRFAESDYYGVYPRVMEAGSKALFELALDYNREQACVTMFRLLCAVTAYHTHHNFNDPPDSTLLKDLTGYTANYDWDLPAASVSAFSDGKWLRANGAGVLYISANEQGADFIIHASKSGDKTAYSLGCSAVGATDDDYVLESEQGIVFRLCEDDVIEVRTTAEWIVANPGRSVPDGMYYLVREKVL